MTRGRKPAEPAQPVGQQLVGATPPADAALEAASNQRLQALVATFHYEGVLREENLEDEIAFHRNRSAESILEMGKRLLLLKELVGHGRFMAKLDALGLHQRAANRFMAVSLKFSKWTTLSILDAAGTPAKLLDLAVLDDEELQTLESGEALGALTLDKVQSMSHRELRDEIHKLKQRVEDQDGRIDKLTQAKEKAEQETTVAARNWREAKADEQEKHLTDEVDRIIRAIKEDLGLFAMDKQVGLRGAMLRLIEHAESHGDNVRPLLGEKIADLLVGVRIVRDSDDVWVPIVKDIGEDPRP